MKDQKRYYSLNIHIVTVFLLIAFSLSGLLIYHSYQKGSELAIHAADQLFKQLIGKVTERINRMYDPVISMVKLTVSLHETSQPIRADRTHPLFHFMTTALDHHPSLYALYLGFENGDFFEVARINDKPEMKKTLSAPEDTYYGIMTVIQDSSGVRSQVWTFLDRNRNKLAESRSKDVDYDPRTRPWYRLGMENDSVMRTKPYVFAKLGQPGVTFAHRFEGTHNGVFGVDISLATLSKFLAEQQFTPSSTILFFDSDGMVTGFPDMARMIKQVPNPDTGINNPTLVTIEDLDQPNLTALFQFFKHGKRTDIITFSVDGQSHIGAITRIPITQGAEDLLGIIAPLDEFLGPIHHMSRNNVLSSILIMLLMMPVIWWVSRRISQPLGDLTEEISKVQPTRLDTVSEVSTRIKEIKQLSCSFKQLTLSLKEYERRLMHTQGQLRLLVELGIALSREQNFDALLESILLNSKRLSYADGGTLYLTGEDNHLHYKIIRNDSLGLAFGGEGMPPMPFKPLPFVFDKEGHPCKTHMATYSALTGKTIQIQNAYADGDSDFPGLREMDKLTGYQSISLLSVPIKPQHGEVLGVLQLINAHDPITGDIVPFDSDTVGFVEALAAQAAIAMENKRLIETQKQVFNAFIQMIATAIDTKSPYTGGHCERVPILAKLLSEAASESESGIFADFKMTDEDRYALHLASWLHDCGKIATPEHIVDKATKLETIHNRIHEIRTRFEVLRRDAHIHYLGRLVKGDNADNLEQQYQTEIAALEDDFAFIAECNVGSEFLDNSKKERIHTIAQRTWMRHFDDNLGISHAEQRQVHQTPEKQRPVQEFLLADKESHKIKRGDSIVVHEHDKEFCISIPELLQNTGEIYNLCIERGTLTTEDRYQITEHIILTIRMLEQLPFPKPLRQVPEYAGAHHETMIGTGYPRMLSREQMSIPARIMAIADIFEALTASDRPYKKAKTLSEAIRIMIFMARDQHIDADIFRLFLEKKIYLQYANLYLSADQIDEVNVMALVQQINPPG